MHKKLLITLLLALPLGLFAQNASVLVNYTMPSEVDYGDDLDIQVDVTNDGTVTIDSDILFNFYISLDYPTTFPPPTTFSIELDNDDDIEPGEQVSDELEIETDDQNNNFEANKQNIVTIWPKVSGNDGNETFDYFIGEIDVVNNDSQPTGIIIKEIPQIAITPNPSSDFINLELPPSHAGVCLNVFSTLGQHVASENVQLEGTVKLDIENFPAGVFVVNIRDKDNKVIYWGRFSKIETR